MTAHYTREPGDIVRIARADGGVDLVEIVSMWTSGRVGIDMLTVVRRPYGVFSFDVRADAVLDDDEPDVRHDALECGPDCMAHKVERAEAGRAEAGGTTTC